MGVGMSIFLMAIAFHTLAQNLVTNPGFEELYQCPGTYNSSTSRKLAPGWRSPTSGTPDLYHKCSPGDAGVPLNWAGKSTAYSGSGYAGIYGFIQGHPREYREYVQSELKTPLEAGSTYLVEFYFKLSSNSKYSIDRLGFLLSDSAHHVEGDGVYPKPPTYEKINQTVYSSRSTGAWTRLGYSYIAKGGERYLTIGNFSNDQQTRYYFIYNSQSTEPMLAHAAYFFIDDVRVIQTSPAKVPLLTGYGEIKTNEDYILRNIQFRYNDYTLIETSFHELRKVVEILNANKTWRVVVSGHTDDIGSEKFNMDLSLNRANSVSEYLISQGIDPSRIKAQGFGKQSPLQAGTDEAIRAINRRVELRFLN
jgi:OmpA-OmpF porin, OOP family